MTSGDWLASAGALWLLAAVILGLAELAIPGVFLIFFAIAAAITGIAALVLADLPIAAQIGAFALWSIVSVLIGKRWYTDYPVASTDPLLNDRAARLIGEIVTVTVPIEHREGRVRIGDGEWPARGDPSPIGTRVRIVAVDDGVVIVEPERSILS